MGRASGIKGTPTEDVFERVYELSIGGNHVRSGDMISVDDNGEEIVVKFKALVFNPRNCEAWIDAMATSGAKHFRSFRPEAVIV